MSGLLNQGHHRRLVPKFCIDGSFSRFIDDDSQQYYNIWSMMREKAARKGYQKTLQNKGTGAKHAWGYTPQWSYS